MIDLRNIKSAVVVGGGTAGWFAALTLRKMFSPNIKVTVVESPKVGTVGVGEGGLLNLISALHFHGIDIHDFINKTGATYKLGFAYEGWITGSKDDIYYHPFFSEKCKISQQSSTGEYTVANRLLLENVPLWKSVSLHEYVENNLTQGAIDNVFKNDESMNPSLHFDSAKVAEYLKNFAVDKDVAIIQGHITKINFDDEGLAQSLEIEDEAYPVKVDFLIDASGFSRKVVSEIAVSEWQSFKDVLPMNKAIPFHMNHPRQNPYLVTRAIAMNAGWMWQIPLKHRVGAGYVFNSDYITEDQAIAEIEEKVGAKIKPFKSIQFEAGCYKRVWTGNVVTVGLASGFVEPLEATSIGQMLEQLRNLYRVIHESGGVINTTIIDQFNNANLSMWLGIRDFIRMHYDTPRCDNEFWKNLQSTPMSESYKSLRELWRVRGARPIDIRYAESPSWQGVFHLLNWMCVGSSLGVMTSQAKKTQSTFFG